MLHQAVAKHQSEQSGPSKPPAPKSSSQQTDIQSAFRSSQTQRSGILGSETQSGVLRNSRPQATNVDPFTASKQKIPPPTTDAANSQLFNAERDTRLLKTLSNDAAFQEHSPPIGVSSVSSSMMNSLHEAVYFDENDFDDDIDLSLDFNVDEPLIPRDLKAAVASIPTSSNPTLPKPTPTTQAQDIPDSSAPLPWSSSPIQYVQPMAAPRRPTGKVFSQETVSQISATSSRTITTSASVKIQDKSIPVEKPKRRLPFLPQSEEGHAGEEPETKKPRGRKPREPRPNRGAPETPHKEPSMPWDTTASAAKAARQEFKVKTTVQRRSISSKAESADLDNVVKRQKEQRIHSIFLSEEQQRVIDLVLASQNSVFFTGSAGTGKSVLLRQLISKLRTKYRLEKDRVAVTASTGLAACNIGGVTLHSFAGIGLGKEAPADLVKKIKRNPKAKNRWLRTKVLIIDEISMVDGELFDKLEGVARIIKNNGRPFGGIQLIITGDFFQLPPVPDNNKIAKFAFEADTWNTSIDHTIGLTQVFRQKDAAFAKMLNEMRLGKLSQLTVNAFKSLQRPLIYNDGIQATELFPTRTEVDAANTAKMRQLAGKVEVFDAIDGGTTTDIKMRDKLLSSCMAPQRIELKINSQVMLIKNVDETLVNGSLGRVVGFMNDNTFELLVSEGNIENYIDGVEDKATVVDDEEDLVSKRRARLKAQITAHAAADTSRKWPLVQFVIPDGTIRQYLVQPETWKVELPNGEVQASRSQIPLILAWALSIHKAQGQTLERVKVDLGKVFEKGQAYVALSRATCQDGLQVLRFDSKKVMAHSKVRAFYASLYSAMEAGKKKAAAAAPQKQLESPDFDDEYDEEDEGASKRRLMSYGSG